MSTTGTQRAAALSPLPRPDRRVHGSRVKIKQGILKSATKLNYDTFKLVIKCDEGSLGGTAGQYATLHTPGLSKPRAYSFARPPEDEAADEHTFFVRVVHGGEFSGWLAEKDRAGAPMTISGPMGKFGVDPSSRPMVWFAISRSDCISFNSGIGTGGSGGGTNARTVSPPKVVEMYRPTR